MDWFDVACGWMVIVRVLGKDAVGEALSVYQWAKVALGASMGKGRVCKRVSKGTKRIGRA
jgi:hypothetical protein